MFGRAFVVPRNRCRADRREIVRILNWPHAQISDRFRRHSVAYGVTFSAYAEELRVGSGETYSSIEAAVDDASSNDVIFVTSGTYEEELTLSSSGAAEHPITIRGEAGAVLRGRIRMQGVSTG